MRRCIAFDDAWGYRRLCVANLFALRATDPAALLAAADPVGPDNDAWLRRVARGAGIVVAAWGEHIGAMADVQFAFDRPRRGCGLQPL